MTKPQNLRITFGFLLSFVTVYPAITLGAEGLEIDLVTHNSVLIHASPTSIWSKILEPGEWKAGAKLIAIEGTPEQSRAKFKAVMPETADQVAFYADNIEVLPERRRTMKLSMPDGSLMGYASWELSELDNSTLVQYHVYSEVVIPEASLTGMSEVEMATLRAGYQSSNYQRFQQELEVLKQLIENPSAVSLNP